MDISTISTKGQVTIPKKIRQRLMLRDGDQIAFIEENGFIIMTKADLASLHEIQDIISDHKFKEIIAKVRRTNNNP
ncbi:AbrB/MazE/SpoVT family DNA-binding domain-containing protein [Jeotgalibacillus soli]|uniref:AbrB family transcriptional regulator n=1 Tax=Jeotgalibacillus soli TaxID=889306 RepID=A0A0C2R6E1_9BACL|nr:AbrB/MazE/SpoVT family DNA-binding domain-containing protein [Jeotgalibacillus soli]KIL45825.1 AbrB family transcriptional regulator [Jeotgalibacillus soli]